MAFKLLQIDFPTTGPWGDEAATTHKDLATSIAGEAGLIWKIWTENPVTGEAGGIYLFEDEASLNAYLTMHTERLKSRGIQQLNVKVFDVNESLTTITHGKLK